MDRLHIFTDAEIIKNLSFSTPRQVWFRHDYDDNPCAGIAYNNEIICLCCGATFPMDEVNYISYYDDGWIDISDVVWGEFVGCHFEPKGCSLKGEFLK